MCASRNELLGTHKTLPSEHFVHVVALLLHSTQLPLHCVHTGDVPAAPTAVEWHLSTRRHAANELIGATLGEHAILALLHVVAAFWASNAGCAFGPAEWCCTCRIYSQDHMRE